MRVHFRRALCRLVLFAAAGFGAAEARADAVGLACVSTAVTQQQSVAPCSNMTVVSTLPLFIRVTFQDPGGLASIVVTLSENADTTVPPITPGTTDPATATITRINQTQDLRVVFRVTDMAGVVTECEVNTAPIPEPATMVLLGTGLAGVAGAVRRRRKG